MCLMIEMREKKISWLKLFTLNKLQLTTNIPTYVRSRNIIELQRWCVIVKLRNAQLIHKYIENYGYGRAKIERTIKQNKAERDQTIL